MNAPLLMSLDAADCGTAPTRWQHQRFPALQKPRIAVIHDGIDTGVMSAGCLMRAGARETVVERYELRHFCLPAQLRLVEALNRGQVRISPVSPEPTLSE